jgi:hypothetical protein
MDKGNLFALKLFAIKNTCFEIKDNVFVHLLEQKLNIFQNLILSSAEIIKSNFPVINKSGSPRIKTTYFLSMYNKLGKV